MKMTEQIVLQSPAAVNRKQPLLLGTAAKEEKKMIMKRDIRNQDRIGELAGGTAADCAAVCCCCPCAVVHLLVLAVYKVPTSLCKKALKKRKRNRLLGKKKKTVSSSFEANQRTTMPQEVEMIISDEDKWYGYNDFDLDSQMWDHFYGAGFWRSSSQKEQ